MSMKYQNDMNLNTSFADNHVHSVADTLSMFAVLINLNISKYDGDRVFYLALGSSSKC